MQNPAEAYAALARSVRSFRLQLQRMEQVATAGMGLCIAALIGLLVL